MKIYVGDLPFGTNEDTLKELFKDYETVTSIDLIKDLATGESKGFAFVEIERQADAENAIKALNGKPVNGRQLKVNQAKPRGSKSRSRR